ncbi:copper resistance protein B [Kangiella sp. TOML190]|uniref:copper resistance protein B n=1 Tax=Kangiella sp. TOML190 TaxID=2931351 RepID=UPI00203F404D|nr:copper resistance protein B [Kangiella sp. TOML190]
MIEQLEYVPDADEDSYALTGDFWIGKDLDKLWFKTELEKEGGDFEGAELQMLYSKAVAAYWDLQLGLKHDFEQPQERTWTVIGLQGLAPYYFEIDSALFIGESGRVAARFEAEYEMLFTQQWILVPELELNFFGQNDPVNQLGSGLADASFGLRLRYEFIREFAVYVGYEYQRKFGKTADFAINAGGAKDSNEWLVGISFWF